MFRGRSRLPLTRSRAAYDVIGRRVNAVEANLDHSRYMELHAYTTEKAKGNPHNANVSKISINLKCLQTAAPTG